MSPYRKEKTEDFDEARSDEPAARVEPLPPSSCGAPRRCTHAVQGAVGWFRLLPAIVNGDVVTDVFIMWFLQGRVVPRA